MWKKLIKDEKEKDYFKDLEKKLNTSKARIYPPQEDVYKAYELCPYEKVKVVILGQDPYHQPHQAMGLSFSVRSGIKLPPSLINIFKELESDLGINKLTGDLSNWASQGVFLLNTY
ncbi:MAG TPA: uracil-DNA glycosylase family protein, partial [Erysipelothrix sp.]|nr:uracil-DNA glycosylase family protein [Erysipelothrix sp.]